MMRSLPVLAIVLLAGCAATTETPSTTAAQPARALLSAHGWMPTYSLSAESWSVSYRARSSATFVGSAAPPRATIPASSSK